MQGYSSSPAHRSNQSLSLAAPVGQPQGRDVRQQRRMTVSSQTSLSLPDNGRQPSPRPPSPLRNSFTMDSSTGIDPDSVTVDETDDDDSQRGRRFHNAEQWQRSASPASSASGIAAGFVQRVNNLVSSVAPRSPGLPSDAELEAEAELERERSRREAEAILLREAQQRKGVEERMLAMMGNANRLPPPPSSQPPPKTPSPSSSHKESGGWWAAAKNKLTPTKDKDSSPITPAQQIILDAKAKEKDDGPPAPSANLNIPMPPPTRKPVPASPSSPTPSRPSLSTPNLSPSPMRQLDSGANSPSREAPPVYVQFTNQGTVDVAGTVLAIAKRFEKLEKWTIGHVRALEDRMNDVERWLVDKENTKEGQNSSKSEGDSVPNAILQQELGEIRDEVSELQGRVGELGREMAKMATSPSNLSSGPKAQTASVSVVPKQASTTAVIHESPVIPAASLEASVAELFSTPRHARLASASARESTSPPLASNARTSAGAGTRLPYPTGDYNSPPETFTPTHSPGASLNSTKRKSMSISSGISGLPSGSFSSLDSPLTSVFNLASTLTSRPMSPPMSSSPSTLPISALSAPKTPSSGSGSGGATSNTTRGASPQPSTPKDKGSLPPPKSSQKRQGSVSPTPRKRYTVALGGPIVAPPELDSPPQPEKIRRPLPSAPASAPTDANDFSRRPVGTPKSATRGLPADDEDDEDDDGGETIGKSLGARWAAQQQTRNLTVQKKRSNTSMSSVASVSSVDKEVFSGRRPPTTGGLSSAALTTGTSAATPSASARRHLRAQSVYGFSGFAASSSSIVSTPAPPAPYTPAGTTAPLRVRSKSSDRLNSDYGGSSGSNSPLSVSTSTANNASSANSSSYFPPVTPSSTKFVDPLLLRRKQEVAAGTGVARAAVALPKPPSGGKLAVGQLVAFFDKDKDKRKGRR